MDTCRRAIDYLRISVTDRCNERCLYCMPEGYKGWERHEHHLTADEILRVVRVAADLGFRKVRVTGGEPLLRADLVEIVSGIASTPGIECVGLSTNGTHLEPLAAPLKAAGLRTVNISLDALDAMVYRRITGGDIQPVLAGLRAALRAGFECIKLNCVLMRGINESEVWPLVLFAAEHQLPLRLIELMPLTTTAVLSTENFFPIAEAKRLMAQKDKLVPEPSARLGWGPAKYYRLACSGALVGSIGALTTKHFCATCNKLRLTADGKLRPCLGVHGELSVREALRNGASEAEMREFMLAAISRKPAAHAFGSGFQPLRPMTAIGG